MAGKWNPKQSPWKDVVSANPVVSLFLARAFVPNLCNLIQSLSSQPLLSCQWPPNLATWTTRHLEPTFRLRVTLPYHQEAERTLKRWARKLSPSCPNTRHCIGIHVTLTEDRSCTSTTSSLDGACSGGHALPWQNRSHQSHRDGPQSDSPLLWETVIGRRPDL